MTILKKCGEIGRIGHMKGPIGNPMGCTIGKGKKGGGSAAERKSIRLPRCDSGREGEGVPRIGNAMKRAYPSRFKRDPFFNGGGNGHGTGTGVGSRGREAERSAGKGRIGALERSEGREVTHS